MKNFCCLRYKAGALALLTAAVFLMTGCATQKIDWNARIGNHSFDQAVVELGPPDKQAKLEDGTIVAEWLTRRGYTQAHLIPGYYGFYGRCYGPVFPTVVESSSPDYYLRLTFGPDGKLRTWKKFAK